MSSLSIAPRPSRQNEVSKHQRNLSELLVRGNIVPIDIPCNDAGVPLTTKAELQRVVQHHVRLGNTHLFVLGETGEFRFMTNDQRQEFAAAFVPLAAKAGLKIFLNVTAENRKLTLTNIEEFGKLPGVGAYILAPLWGEGNFSLLQDLSKRSDKCGRPFVLYNNPGITKGNIPEAALWAARGGYIALKDSSGDVEQSARYIKEIALMRTLGTSALRFYLGAERLAYRFISPGKDESNGAAWGLVGSSDNIGSFGRKLVAEEKTEKRLELADKLMDIFSRIYDRGSCGVAAQKFILFRAGVFSSPSLCKGNPSVLPVKIAQAIESSFSAKSYKN